MVLNERKVFISAPPPKKKNGAKITFVWPNVKLGDIFILCKIPNTITSTLLREQEENALTVWGKFCFHIHICVSLYLNFSLDKKINIFSNSLFKRFIVLSFTEFYIIKYISM